MYSSWTLPEASQDPSRTLPNQTLPGPTLPGPFPDPSWTLPFPFLYPFRVLTETSKDPSRTLLGPF